jgi:hypothetical protein
MIAEISHGGVVFGLGVLWFGAIGLAFVVSDFRRGSSATRRHGPGRRYR